jgi:hypothetical protein
VRRLLSLLILVGLLAGATAVAQDGGSGGQGPYDLAEPPVASADVIKLPGDADCVHFTLATVRFLPPPGAVFGVLTVSSHGREVARMTGVPRAASVTVRIGDRTRVTVSGTTLGGQVVTASRSYRRCGAPVRRELPPATEVGGGEEG